MSEFAASKSKSPKPKGKKETKTMTFPEALKYVIGGRKITKLEWEDKEWYGVLSGGWLKIHKPDNTLSKWTLNDGDLIGDDWVLV